MRPHTRSIVSALLVVLYPTIVSADDSEALTLPSATDPGVFLVSPYHTFIGPRDDGGTAPAVVESAGDAYSAALDFLRRHADTYAIPIDETEFGFPSLRVRATLRLAGYQIVQLRQSYNGFPIMDGDGLNVAVYDSGLIREAVGSWSRFNFPTDVPTEAAQAETAVLQYLMQRTEVPDDAGVVATLGASREFSSMMWYVRVASEEDPEFDYGLVVDPFSLEVKRTRGEISPYSVSVRHAQFTSPNVSSLQWADTAVSAPSCSLWRMYLCGGSSYKYNFWLTNSRQCFDSSALLTELTPTGSTNPATCGTSSEPKMWNFRCSEAEERWNVSHPGGFVRWTPADGGTGSGAFSSGPGSGPGPGTCPLYDTQDPNHNKWSFGEQTGYILAKSFLDFAYNRVFTWSSSDRNNDILLVLFRDGSDWSKNWDYVISDQTGTLIHTDGNAGEGGRLVSISSNTFAYTSGSTAMGRAPQPMITGHELGHAVLRNYGFMNQASLGDNGWHAGWHEGMATAITRLWWKDRWDATSSPTTYGQGTLCSHWDAYGRCEPAAGAPLNSTNLTAVVWKERVIHQPGSVKNLLVDPILSSDTDSYNGGTRHSNDPWATSVDGLRDLHMVGAPIAQTIHEISYNVDCNTTSSSCINGPGGLPTTSQVATGVGEAMGMCSGLSGGFLDLCTAERVIGIVHSFSSSADRCNFHRGVALHHGIGVSSAWCN